MKGCLRYVEKIKAVRSLQYVENRSLHNVEFLQALHKEEMISQQYVEKVKVCVTMYKKGWCGVAKGGIRLEHLLPLLSRRPNPSHACLKICKLKMCFSLEKSATGPEPIYSSVRTELKTGPHCKMHYAKSFISFCFCF